MYKNVLNTIKYGNPINCFLFNINPHRITTFETKG